MVKISKIKAEQEYNKFLKQIESKYGNKETTNLQLDKIGKKYFGIKYRGTFSSDNIPIMRSNQYAIINLDNSSQRGSHWIALVKKPKITYVYDSFGRSTFKILPGLKQSGNGAYSRMTENDAEQDRLEQNCGQRSISALRVYDKYGWDGLKYI